MYAELPRDIRNSHPFHMVDEIKAQPSAVGRSLSLASIHSGDLARAMAEARRVFVTGCGTSFHAALGGAWFLRSLSRGAVDARAVGALDLAAYEWGISSNDVVIGVTHAAETPMTLRALEQAQAAGARTVAVTGFPDRLNGALIGQIVPTGFPEEESWAHTASYTAALTTLCAIANMVAHPEERLDLDPLPEVVAAAVELEEMTHRLAGGTLVVERYQDPARIAIVGGGPNAATAREGVLKLLETSYVAAEWYELEYMLHGPLAAVTSETLMIVLAPDGATVNRAADLTRAVLQLDVTPIVLTGNDTADRFEGAHRLVMPDVPEVISPIPYVVPLQLFSYYLAVGKGLNPDLIHRDDERHRTARAQYE